MLGGEMLPDLVPDTRQGWVEKWLLLAAEERRAEAEEPEANGSGGLAGDELARQLGAVEKR